MFGVACRYVGKHNINNTYSAFIMCYLCLVVYILNVFVVVCNRVGKVSWGDNKKSPENRAESWLRGVDFVWLRLHCTGANSPLLKRRGTGILPSAFCWL